MPMPTSIVRACVALGLATGATAIGCANFQDESTVIDLRILGAMAEPSEIYIDPTTLDPTDPMYDGTQVFRSTLTALVVDPAGQGRPVSYSVFACPREIDTVTAATGRNGVVCDHDANTTREVLDPPGPRQTSDSGPEHDIAFPFAASAPDLAGAFLLDPIALAGFQLPIVIQLELSAGSESIVATKRVIFSKPVEGHEDQPPNANPVINTVLVYPARDDRVNPIGPIELPPDGPNGAPPAISVPLGGGLWFQPVGAIAEPYWTRTATRDDPPQVAPLFVPAETLRFAFFTNAGSFSPITTNTTVSVIREEQDRIHLEARYSAPQTMPADPNVTIWIVVRDERGGASWIKRRITLVAP
jgi:hypothetical protein